MSEVFDIIIIGAGPAGMAAAQFAAEYGAKTLILDEQAAIGGQIYRAIDRMKDRKRGELGESYYDGLKLTKAFHQSQIKENIHYIPKASVWQLSKELEVGYSSDGVAQVVSAKEIIVATGAQERPFPVSGWTLPGVMTIGAAQILLKESELVVEDAIFAGTGPLFYLVIHQYLTAGIPVKAIVDLTPKSNYLKALPHLPKALSGFSKIREGWKWKRDILKSNIPYFSNITDLKIAGNNHVEGVDYKQDATWKHINAKHVLLHQGIVPNINISLAAGCKSSWDNSQVCWTIDVDPWFQSSIPGISIAGDGASIGGAIAAKYRGHIAAIGVLEKLDKITSQQRDNLASPYQKSLASEMRVRPFLNALFKPADNFRIPEDKDTIVCRCEEITTGQIREVVDNGCAGPNQLKSFSRCGMGSCQGRFCGLTVSELIADTLNKPVSDIGYYRLRPPIKPLLLQELANLDISGD